MLKAMRELPEFHLVHGVFNKQDDVFAALKERCAAKGIDFGRFSWDWQGRAAVEDREAWQAPEFDPDDPETVVVLDATLDTLQNTFEFAWVWTGDGQDKRRRHVWMKSDAEKLALLDGLEFKPWTLRWVRIKLDTNVGKKPVDVRDPKCSPGCALLFMSAEHPARIKAIDYKKRYGYWLPGLKCTVPLIKQWQAVPYVICDHGTRVGLDAYWDVGSLAHLAVPSFRPACR